ncbi:hypothetical protein [Amycolatopsis sp. ATCC 39116]|uniref:hypothetical protein n=1 Tax=Amycolatopsis sp. (strain ATCC 39116 / 75iv2) TaxID=385957 RepID=UPI0002626D27|nr:hypothetical protein [Amycolatopsis sp. ATCC 39116]
MKAKDQLSLFEALPWFVPDVPAPFADERRAHLFADEQPYLGYRIARCGERRRIWTAIEHVPGGEQVPRCAKCLAVS